MLDSSVTLLSIVLAILFVPVAGPVDSGVQLRLVDVSADANRGASSAASHEITLELVNGTPAPIWVLGSLSDTACQPVNPAGNWLLYDRARDTWRPATKSGVRLSIRDFAAIERQAYSIDPGESVVFKLALSPGASGWRLKRTVFVSDFLGLSNVVEIESDEILVP